MYTMYTMYMNLAEQIRKVYKITSEEMGNEKDLSRTKFRTVGNRNYVIHTQKDGSERVFDMLTGKEVIEGEIA